MMQKDSDAGNRTRGKHVRDAYVTNYTTSDLMINTFKKFMWIDMFIE